MEDLARSLLSELNLDDNNLPVITSKVQEAWALIKDSIDNNADDEELAKDDVFILAVKSLATQLFYDRTLSGGTSIGIQMMINHLVGKVGKDGYSNKSN